MKWILVPVLVLVACDGGKQAPITPDGANPDADVPMIDAPLDMAETAPLFRYPVGIPDNELALQALQILGADVENATAVSCNSCHGMTRSSIETWAALSETAMTSCFTDLYVTSQQTAQQMIDCFRTMPSTPTSDFSTAKLGVYSSAARLPWFRYTFQKAYGGVAAGDAALEEFVGATAMPRGTVVPSLTQAQFDIIAEWFARGLPMLAETLAPPGMGTTCTPAINPELMTHVSTMATTGWRAVNRTNNMAMYGCGSATDPLDCLQSHALGTSFAYGAGWDLPNRGHARVLKDVTYRSYFWTRSSSDGRFIAHGVENVPGSAMIDLQRDVVVTIANTQYDPTFFPDDAGFIFQGGTQNPRNNVCAMSVLTSNPSTVAMNEAACSRASMVGLYQHTGRALGGDYFAIDGQFTNDNGGHTVTRRDPNAGFDSMGRIDFTPMVFDGTRFVQSNLTRISTPYEGDAVLSPSSELVMSRNAGANDVQNGFTLRKFTRTWNGSTYDMTTTQVGRYCVPGAKVAFSFDERWVTYHHYVTSADFAELGFASATDPGFVPYTQLGAANIYVLDLTTGMTKRITNMAPGQYALFPHYRSDGWIYADVRDINTDHEYFIAHDGGLILEQ